MFPQHAPMTRSAIGSRDASSFVAQSQSDRAGILADPGPAPGPRNRDDGGVPGSGPLVDPGQSDLCDRGFMCLRDHSQRLQQGAVSVGVVEPSHRVTHIIGGELLRDPSQADPRPSGE